jgi:PKD repeat protein
VNLSRLLICVASVLLVAALPVRGETLGEGWPYHRKLTVNVAPSDAPGDNLAWAQFYTNGTQRPDGNDFRVTTAEGVLVPMRLMRISADDDLVRIAFVTRSSGIYSVYWGNPKADKPGPQADIRRGVWCEIFKFPGGDLGGPDRIRAIFDRVKIVEGSVFLPEIFLGHNPLGEENNIMFRYRTQFKIDKPGSYDIAYAVDDAGYVTVDGQTVMHIGSVVTDARNHKVLDLKPGWHQLEVTQINLEGPTFVAMAWKRPGEGRFETMPRTVFPPVAEATVGPLQKLGQGYLPDCAVRPMGEAFTPPEHYLQMYEFDIDNPPSSGTFSWDFGDGQTAGNIAKINHVFMTPGIYNVTLTMTNGRLETKTTRRISVQERMYSKFPYPPDEPSKAVVAVLEKYDRNRLNAGQRLRGYWYFKHEHYDDHTMDWGKSWEEANEAQNDQTVWEETVDLANLCESHGNYEQAANMYLLAANKPISMETRLKCFRTYVITACDNGIDPDAVLRVIEQWNQKIDSHNEAQVHGLQAASLYAATAKGDAKLAAKLVALAATRGQKEFTQQEIHEGVLARNIETYIRTHEFETAANLINRWEFETPEAMLEGFTRLLKMKLLMAESRPLIAARVGQQLARTNPNSFYAAELLYRASEALKVAGKMDEAATVMKILRDKYPESPYARGDKVKTD